MGSFIPTSPVWTIFAATVTAASGTVVQASYTVPNGQTARLKYAFIQAGGNASAANTMFLIVDVIPVSPVASFPVLKANVSGIANQTYYTVECDIPLIGGDLVRCLSSALAGSANTAATIYFMIDLRN